MSSMQAPAYKYSSDKNLLFIVLKMTFINKKTSLVYKNMLLVKFPGYFMGIS